MLRKKIFVLLAIAIALSFIPTPTTATIKIVRGIYIRRIEPSEGSPGTKVLVFGDGATPNGTVEALLSSEEIVVVNSTIVIIGNLTLGWTIADAEGHWEIIFVVPDVSPGNYTVFAIDKKTKTIDAIGFVVLPTYIGIKIEHVSPQSGPVGTTVYISGSGATPYGEVRVFFDNMNVANTTAKEGGWWGVSFKVPNVEPQEYTIMALDVMSNKTDTTSFIVTPPPTISVSPSEAPIGSKISISGEGFPSKTGLFLTFEDLVLFSFITTDEKGEFNVTVFVPMVNSGDYTIKAITTYPYPVMAVSSVSFIVTEGVNTLLSGVPQGLRKGVQTHAYTDSKHNSSKAYYNPLSSVYDSLKSALNVADNLSYLFTIVTIVFMAATVYLVLRKPKIKSI